MSIDRAPFNALIDDDGSGLTGSVWNKAAIQNVLLNPIDAACSTAITSVTVGQTDIVFENPAAQIQYVRLFTDTADITIRSMQSLPFGSIAILQNIAQYNVYLQHNVGNGPGTVLSNRIASGPTPLAPYSGSAIYVREYDLAGWYLAQHDQGRAIDVPFNAANFSPGWTVTQANVKEQSYYIVGNVAHIKIDIVQSSVAGGGGATLSVAGWPLSFAIVNVGSGMPGWTSLGPAGWGLMQAYAVGGTQIGFIRPDYGAWPSSSGQGYFGFDGKLRIT